MPASKKDSSESTAIERMVSDDQLRSLHSFDEAASFVEEFYGGIVDATEEIGTGFQMLDNKDALLEVPLIIVSFSIVESKTMRDADGNPSTFSALRVVTKHDERFIVIDGSTGIHQQLMSLRERTGKTGGILVRNGLRKSEYDYTDPHTGQVSRAVTHYLNV